MRSSFGLHSSRLGPSQQRHFEGWYTRIVARNHSFGLVTGHFPGQEEGLKHPSTYAAVLWCPDHRGARARLHAFECQPGTLALARDSQPPAALPAPVEAWTEAPDFALAGGRPGAGAAAVAARGQRIMHAATAGGASLSVETAGPLTRWDGADGGSPEGLLQSLPGLGLHWYVHATRAPVRYDFTHPDGSRLAGEGWAHVEKNWGAAFPREFVWAQGFATDIVTAAGRGGGGGADGGGADGDSFGVQAEFALAGGVLPALGLDKLHVPLPQFFLVGYRSPKLHWDFAPHKGLSIFEARAQAKDGRLELIATQALTRRQLVLTLQAAVDSFSRVQGPSRGGFVGHSVETYAAHAMAECYESGKLVEARAFDRVALEFGGAAACEVETAAGRGCEGLVCEPQYEG